MSQTWLNRSVTELLQEAPARARVFERFAIDYGCASGLTLAEACRQQRLDPESVAACLATAQPEAETPFTRLRLSALTEEIVARHHVYARESGERIQPLLDKVARVHGGKEPRLRELWCVFQQLHAELLMHMLKEERVLFPYCRQLEAATEDVNLPDGSVAMPIRMMEAEHLRTERQMAQLRTLTDDFTPPAWACNSLRVLYHELQHYSADLETHMHLENNLLFPAALRREDALRQARAD